MTSCDIAPESCIPKTIAQFSNCVLVSVEAIKVNIFTGLNRPEH